MQWIAAAIVFCFLMWKWPRKTTIASVAVAACVSIGIAFLFLKDKMNDINYKENLASINATPSIGNGCPRDHPFRLTIYNKNKKTAYFIRFTAYGYEPGRSSSLVKYPTGIMSTDVILKGGSTTTECFKMPEIVNRADPEYLRWEVSVDSVSFYQ